MLKLDEIAARISAHLKRFEEDPAINQYSPPRSTRPYYQAGAARTGSYVSVSYVNYQGSTSLKRVDAMMYLAWLDKGNVGRHWEALRDANSSNDDE